MSLASGFDGGNAVQILFPASSAHSLLISNHAGHIQKERYEANAWNQDRSHLFPIISLDPHTFPKKWIINADRIYSL